MKSVCAEALGINRKNIYRQLKQPAKDQALKEQIEAAHRQHPAYGHRRIAIHLGINRKRAQRVMALFNLRPPRRRCKRYSTVSTPPPYLQQPANRYDCDRPPSGVV